jgi:hypothetical protein
MRSPIFGGYSTAPARNLAYNRCINLYAEVVDTKDGKAIGGLFGTPGLTLWKTVDEGPIRGIWQLSSQVNSNEIYVVSNINLYKVNDGATTLIPVAAPYTSEGIAGFGPVEIIDNGTQLAIFTPGIGAAAYLFDTAMSANVQKLALPFVPSGAATYQDGFGLAAQQASFEFFQSDLNNLGNWNALNFASADSLPDHIVALAQIHREIFVIKQTHTEVWVNAGLAGFAFQRLPNVYIESGCVAPASVAIVAETLVWLARNREGQPVVMQISGYQPAIISTFSMAEEISKYSTVTDATAFAFMQGGHIYYQINFPSGDMSWVYDHSVSRMLGYPVWHQRLAFDGGMFSRHWADNAWPLVDGRIVVGDYRAHNGNLYFLDPNNLTDNGQIIKRLRTWRALPQPTDSPTRFSSLRIDMETGINVPDGTSPLGVMRWSDDGGYTWSTERMVSLGAPGETSWQVMYRRLGSTRRLTGLDRIFEFSVTDQCPVNIIGAELR